jgi:hypothetical protein
MGRLPLYATLIVLAHCPVVIWHLLVLSKLPSGLTTERALFFAALINLIPFAAAILSWTRHRKLAGGLLLIAFGFAFCIGAYAHFLSPGSDNVFTMPHGDWTLPFQLTAILLILLQASGCWLAAQLIRAARPTLRV